MTPTETFVSNKISPAVELHLECVFGLRDFARELARQNEELRAHIAATERNNTANSQSAGEVARLNGELETLNRQFSEYIVEAGNAAVKNRQQIDEAQAEINRLRSVLIDRDTTIASLERDLREAQTRHTSAPDPEPAVIASPDVAPIPRKRGRPKGSTNRPRPSADTSSAPTSETPSEGAEIASEDHESAPPTQTAEVVAL